MPREVGVYLADIAEAIGRIRSYTEGMDLAGFRAEGKTVDAVLHNLCDQSSVVEQHARETTGGGLEPFAKEPHTKGGFVRAWVQS
jgi:hypothetical protein